MLARVIDVGGKKHSTDISFGILTDMRFSGDVVLLAETAHAESRFSHISFSKAKVIALVEKAVSRPKQSAVFMCWKGDQPVGFAACSVGEYHIGEGALISTVHNLNVLKEVRFGLRGGRVALGLLRGVEAWSRARGACEILFHVTSDVEVLRTDKFMKRIGFKEIGGSYAKPLST